MRVVVATRCGRGPSAVRDKHRTASPVCKHTPDQLCVSGALKFHPSSHPCPAMNDVIQSAFNNTPTGILRQARVACFDFGVHGVCEGGGWKWAVVLCRVAGEPARAALGGEVSRCNGLGGGGGLMRVLGGSSPCLASAFPFSLGSPS